VRLTFDSDGPYVSCSSLWNTFDSAKIEFNLGYSDDGVSWNVCRNVGPFTYNNTYYAYSKTVERYWSRPCGSGYYRTFGGTWGRRDAAWRGGWVNSTKHYLSPGSSPARGPQR
jgi:hypothetical protein